MRRLISTVCGMLFGMVLATTLPAKADQMALQGNWTATKAERDGKSADDVIGHRLSFSEDRFEIRSDKGETVFAGTVRVDAGAQPASVDFGLDSGAPKGTAWKGIYAIDGDTLTICDNAPDPKKDRPTAFEAKSGSGYVLVTFKRAQP